MSYATYQKIGKDPEEPSPESQAVIPHVKTLEERKDVISRYPLVVIDYYTDWCGPCKACAPKFAQIAQKYQANGVAFLKEDAELQFGDHPPIRGVPTFHFYFKGKILKDLTIVGADVEKVEEHIQGIIKATKDKQENNQTDNTEKV